MSIGSENLPITVIGGYLGTGKTTVVNHLLRNADGLRLAVLVNEFGELPIDEDLIEAEGDDLISIAGGCVCCSFGNDLVAALMKMATINPRPDHILIESSGVAIPGAIVSTMSLLEGFQPNGIVVVVDAETVRHQAANDYIGDTILRQLADADIVIVNKQDLVNPQEFEQLQAWLSETDPCPALIPARQGKVAIQAVLGNLHATKNTLMVPHSDKLFDSFVLEPDGTIDIETLAQQLATGMYGVVRSKGYAKGPDDRVYLVHTVGQRWQVSLASASARQGIVCIGLRGQLATENIKNLGQNLALATP